MLAITILVAATALVLGLRFNPLVLGLLLLVAAASIFVISIWSGGNALVVALLLLATLASGQIGYLIGCLIAAQFPAQAETPSGRMQTRYSQIIYPRGDALTPRTPHYSDLLLPSQRR